MRIISIENNIAGIKIGFSYNFITVYCMKKNRKVNNVSFMKIKQQLILCLLKKSRQANSTVLVNLYSGGVNNNVQCKKSNDFPVPSRDVTDQILPGREKFNYSRPGKLLTFFYSVGH